MEIEGIARARAGTTDVAWAKEELDKCVAQIQRLETENEELRRANKVIELERDKTKKAYHHLVDQVSHYRRCMERLKIDKPSLPAAPTESESEIRTLPEPIPLTDPRHLYRDSILPCDDSTSAPCTVAHPAARSLSAQSASPVGNVRRYLTASLRTDSVASDNNRSLFFTDASPIPSSRHTQPSSVSSFGDGSPDRSSRNVLSTPSRRLNDSRKFTKAGLLETRSGQAISQHPRLEDPAAQPGRPWGDVEEGLGELSERNLLAETSKRRNCIHFGHSFLSRAPSDTSMQSVSELGEDNDIEVEIESAAQVSSRSDSSSDESDNDSDDSSDGRRPISGSGSGQASKLTGFGYTDTAGMKAPESHRYRDFEQAFVNCNTTSPLEQDSRTTHPRNGLPRRRADKPRLSSKAHTATNSSEPLKARSIISDEVIDASTILKPRATHSQTTSGSPRPTLFGPSTRVRTNQTSPAVSTPSSDGQRCEELTRCGEEETDMDLKTAIRESYARFALTSQQLRFCYEPQTLDPTSINLNTNWKRRSKLNESIVEKLLQMGSEISAFLPKSGSEMATKKETDLIRRLCRLNQSQTACGSLRELVGALRREREVTKDELNLIDFEIYSTLIVMKSQSESEFDETIAAFSGYQCTLLGTYNSLHAVIARLDQAWHGLHLLVLVYLLRVGPGRLVKYFVPTTRPAAIELLLQRFKKPELMADHRRRLYGLLSASGSACVTHIQQVTPLKRLQNRMNGALEPSLVRAALGYSDQYQRHAESNVLQPHQMTRNAITTYPQPPTPSSERCSAYNPLGDQDTVNSALRSRSQCTEAPYLTAIDEGLGPRKTICHGVIGVGGGDSNRPARKRRCGTDRMNGYDTGSLQDRTVQSSGEPTNLTRAGSVAEVQFGCGYDASNDEATEGIDNLCTNLHIATDLESPWPHIPPVPAHGYLQMQEIPQVSFEENYSAGSTTRSPDTLMYHQWCSSSPQQAPNATHQQGVNQTSHRNSPAARLPQEVIDSVEDGTVDPRALNLRC